MAASNRGQGLAALLAPVTVETFVDEFLERAPLHVERNDAAYVAALLGIGDIEDVLVANARDPERIALVRAGQPQVELSGYTFVDPGIRGRSTGKTPQRRIDVRKVVSLFAAGYTLVLNDAGAASARLQRTCNRLQNDLGAYVGANVYFTPGGAQGLDVHHDSHDTLTIQIEGTKTWRIYAPAVVLPVESQSLHRETPVPPLRFLREVTLEPGDTLYIPRGFPHAAAAAAGRSLHVTFALAPVRVVDLLEAAIRAGAERHPDLRRALPFGWHKRATFATEIAAILAPYAATILGREHLAVAAEDSLKELFAASRSEAGGAFDQAQESNDLTAASRLALNDAIPFLVRERAATLDLLLPGKTLHLPKECAGALEQLEAGPVRYADLEPEFAAEDRALLVRTLVVEGLVLIT